MVAIGCRAAFGCRHVIIGRHVFVQGILVAGHVMATVRGSATKGQPDHFGNRARCRHGRPAVPARRFGKNVLMRLQDRQGRLRGSAIVCLRGRFALAGFRSRFHGQQQVQCRIVRQPGEPGRKRPVAAFDHALDEAVLLMGHRLDQRHQRAGRYAEPVKIAGTFEDFAIRVHERGMVFLAGEPRDHLPASAGPARFGRYGKQDGRLALRHAHAAGLECHRARDRASPQADQHRHLARQMRKTPQALDLPPRDHGKAGFLSDRLFEILKAENLRPVAIRP